ncbi:DNA repair protein recA homolog 2, mitochondrial isoform X1 [Elaeis guineensis]|uniref:DNA repair protein recA homolog 2, mitochondrial isoform X2 n=1 Tax=Elaeis guineensis var. tenera TaxID=51953 RepID=A0A6I9S775_ELAGV|nr:DNA repair protein recA homolog 2, mitochondrial isoform X2 [Elaeis guineensis]
MRALRPLSLSSSLLRAIYSAGAGGRPLRGPSPLCFLLQNGGSKVLSFSRIKGRLLSSTVETLLEYERDQPFDDQKVIEKDSTLNLALSQLAADFDVESNLSLSRFFCTRYTHVISTGSLKLDLALGIGGLPKGRMIEIYGREASGKTTLALHIVKEAQKLGGYCAYLDVENALDPALAEAMGVNTENLLISHPNCAENSLSIVNTLVNSGSVDVVVVDSVAALVPQCELEGLIDINSQEVQSRFMTQALKKIQYSLSRSQTLVIFINQVRTNLRSNRGFGEMNEVTCGGNALKFYAAVRMRITRRGLLHNEDKITGIGLLVQVMKNKLAPAMKKATLDLGFGRGICLEAEVLEMATKHGLVLREGTGYWIEGEFLKDQQEAELFLEKNNAVVDEFVRTLRNQLFQSGTKTGI